MIKLKKYTFLFSLVTFMFMIGTFGFSNTFPFNFRLNFTMDTCDPGFIFGTPEVISTDGLEKVHYMIYQEPENDNFADLHLGFTLNFPIFYISNYERFSIGLNVSFLQPIKFEYREIIFSNIDDTLISNTVLETTPLSRFSFKVGIPIAFHFGGWSGGQYIDLGSFPGDIWFESGIYCSFMDNPEAVTVLDIPDTIILPYISFGFTYYFLSMFSLNCEIGTYLRGLSNFPVPTDNAFKEEDYSSASILGVGISLSIPIDWVTKK